MDGKRIVYTSRFVRVILAQGTKLDHYMLCGSCPILWSILHEAFEGTIAPTVVGRLNYIKPSKKQVILISAAFEIYHALKIGLRSIVDESQASQRFAEIIRIASKLAKESHSAHLAIFRPHLARHENFLLDPRDSSVSGAASRTTSHHSHSSVGALRSLPRNHAYRRNMHIPTGPLTPSRPVTFSRADHIDYCPSWLGIPTVIDPDSDLEA